MLTIEDLEKSHRDISARIAAAALRAGRDPQRVRLLAVTKTVDAARIQAAWALGLREVAENKIQEALAKQPLLSSFPLNWHFIGHLQTNKVRKAVGKFSLIHSVDSWHLAEALHQEALRIASIQPILVQARLSGEPGRYGFELSELEDVVVRVGRQLPGLRVKGLMAIAPLGLEKEELRSCFRALRQRFDTLAAMQPDGVEMTELSLGMSGDFETAIEEGSTMVRLGTALFGART